VVGPLSANLKQLLVSRGCCDPIEGNTNHLLDAQLRTFRCLQRKLDSGTDEEIYLRTYDSIMRVVESWLIRQSLLFGLSPHTGLRLIVSEYFPSQEDQITELIRIRHQVKKDGLAPSAKQLSDLQSMFQILDDFFGPVG
jgi:hypothetical protein